MASSSGALPQPRRSRPGPWYPTSPPQPQLLGQAHYFQSRVSGESTPTASAPDFKQSPHTYTDELDQGLRRGDIMGAWTREVVRRKRTMPHTLGRQRQHSSYMRMVAARLWRRGFEAVAAARPGSCLGRGWRRGLGAASDGVATSGGRHHVEWNRRQRLLLEMCGGC